MSSRHFNSDSVNHFVGETGPNKFHLDRMRHSVSLDHELAVNREGVLRPGHIDFSRSSYLIAID